MSSHHASRSLVAFAAFAGAIVLSVPLEAQRATATRLDRDPAGQSFSSQPKIAVSGDRVYVVWHDDRNGSNDIYFNRSFDRGATWLAQDVRLDTDLPGAAMSLRPQIAVSGNDIYVVWLDARAGSILNADIYFNRSTDAGATWLSQDVRLDTDPGSNGSQNPVICADGDAVYVAWIDFRHSVGFRDIYFNRSLDRGVSWLTQDVRLNTNPPGTATHTDPQIACDGMEVYVTWSSGRTPPGLDVYLNRSADGGSTWLAQDVRLDGDLPGAASSVFVNVACEGDNVYVAWHDDRNGEPDAYINVSNDNGATWLGEARLDTDPLGAALSNYPDICCENGKVWVFWEDWRNGPVTSTATADVYMNRSTDAGATWLPADVRISHVPLPSGGAGDHTPSLPQGSCSANFVAVCWVDVRNGLSDVYYNRSFDGGATWLASDVRLDADTPGAHYSTSAEIASTGNAVHVVWEDDRNGATDIYWNIPFGALAYGNGTAGSGGLIPQLDGGGVPAIGKTFNVRATNALGGVPGALLLGAQKVALPLFGGTIHVLPLLAPGVPLGGAPGVPGAGMITLPFAVPNNTAFIGGMLLFQVLAVDPSAPGGLSMTNGIEVWIG